MSRDRLSSQDINALYNRLKRMLKEQASAADIAFQLRLIIHAIKIKDEERQLLSDTLYLLGKMIFRKQTIALPSDFPEEKMPTSSDSQAASLWRAVLQHNRTHGEALLALTELYSHQQILAHPADFPNNTIPDTRGQQLTSLYVRLIQLNRKDMHTYANLAELLAQDPSTCVGNIGLVGIPEKRLEQAAFFCRLALLLAQQKNNSAMLFRLYPLLARLIFFKSTLPRASDFIDGHIPETLYEQVEQLCYQSMTLERENTKALALLATLLEKQKIKANKKFVSEGHLRYTLHDQVASLYLRIIESEPDNIKALLALARLLKEGKISVEINLLPLKNSDKENAKTICQYVLTLDPKNKDAILMLEALTMTSSPTLLPKKPSYTDLRNGTIKQTESVTRLSISRKSSLFSIYEESEEEKIDINIHDEPNDKLEEIVTPRFHL